MQIHGMYTCVGMSLVGVHTQLASGLEAQFMQDNTVRQNVD